MCKRSDDLRDRVHFRSERIACQNGFYYFNTREGTLEGPYRSRDQAEVAVAFYIRCRLDPSCVDSSRYAPDPVIHRYTECKHSLQWRPPTPADDMPGKFSGNPPETAAGNEVPE